MKIDEQAAGPAPNGSWMGQNTFPAESEAG